MRTQLVIAFLIGVQCAFGQKLTGDDVLRKVEQNFREIKDYSVTLDIVADIERMKIPPMHATMFFKQPEKVHFDAKGFVFLPREGMGVQFGRLTQRYAVDSMAKENEGNSEKYRLVLHPREETAVIRRLFMWVDATRWMPDRVLIPQRDGRAMEAHFTYERQADRFWLPTQLEVSFQTSAKDTTTAAPPANPFERGMPTGSRSNARSGKVTVKYSDYRVNIGLPDSLFTEPEQRR
jgi:outer membrane lipoprotein-sorting protein